jgi:sterol desaturase/sphingolipid hydroxylase (fatty acid hydroxylase superfamily)
VDNSTLASALVRILPILGLLTFLSMVEFVIPLRNQARNALGRLRTNLTLIGITLILGTAFNAMLLAGAHYVNRAEFGLFPALDAPAWLSLLIAIVILDFTTYLAHVAMHRYAWLWRIHVVHHADAAIDATTALRQHPLEGLIRFAVTAATAWSLGATPEVIAIYRLLSTGNALVEHANIRLPGWLERTLIALWVTPNMHKMHHSRLRRETDSNYSNLFSFNDRLFGTFSRSDRAAEVVYGIEGKDDRHSQSLRGALQAPF